MPPLSSEVLALMAAVATVIVQLVKGLLPERVKQFLPLILCVLMVPLGTLLAAYYGRDPVAGALEGLFAFGSSVGFYEGASELPGVKSVFNGKDWLVRSE